MFGEDTEKLAILRKIRQDFCLDSAHAAQLQRNLGGALKRLGEDLYREQHHFVFELLQNGDDNKYPEKEIPCYKLILCHLDSGDASVFGVGRPQEGLHVLRRKHAGCTLQRSWL
jgi:hypothetical protein